MCKVFAFGQGHKKIFAFQKKPMSKVNDTEEEDKDQEDSIDEQQLR